MTKQVRSRTVSCLFLLIAGMSILVGFSSFKGPLSVKVPDRLVPYLFDTDPIRFTMTANKKRVPVGEEIEISLTAHFFTISPALLYTSPEASTFRIKVLMPEGFVQTGGDYVDYIGSHLSSANPIITYTLKGYFTRADTDNQFRLLRGPHDAGVQSLFVEKGQLTFHVVREGRQAAASGTSTHSSGNGEVPNASASMVVSTYSSGNGGGTIPNASASLVASNNATLSVDCGAASLNVSGSLSTSNNNRISILIFKDNAIVNVISDVPGPSYNQTVGLSGPGNYYAKVREVNNDANEVNSAGASVNCSSNPTPPTTSTPPSGGNGNNATLSVNCGASSLNVSGSLSTSNNNRISMLIFKDNAIVNMINDMVGPSFNQTIGLSGPGNYYAKVREVNNDANEVNSAGASVNCSSTSNPPTTSTPPSGGNSSNSGNGSGTSTPVTTCSVANPRGNVDVVTAGVLSGWAFDESNFGNTLLIDIYANGVKVATVPANEDRPDLVGAFGNNPAARYHGFSAEWDYFGQGTQSYNISIQICGTSTPLRTQQVTFQNASDPNARKGPIDGGTLDVEVTVKAKRNDERNNGSNTGNGPASGSGSDGGNGSGSGSGSSGGSDGSSSQTSPYQNRGGGNPYSANPTSPTSTTNPSSLTNPKHGDTYIDSEGNIITYNAQLGGWMLPETSISPYDKEGSTIGTTIPWFYVANQAVAQVARTTLGWVLIVITLEGDTRPGQVLSKGGDRNIWPDQYGNPPRVKDIDWSKGDSQLADDYANAIGDTKRGPGTAHNNAKKWFRNKRPR